MEKSFYPGPARWVWVAFFVVLTSTLMAGGYAYYRSETERIRQDKYHEIAAIAKLKAGQIQQWRQELLRDLWTPSRGPFVRKAVEEWLREPNNSGLRTQLQDRLVSEQQSEGCYDTLLLDTEGRILLSAMPQPEPLSPFAKLAIDEALAKHTAVLSDLYRSSQGIVLVDAVAPILDSQERPIAVLVFRSNAESLLYPLIQSWPTPSRTSETLLVRKEGENVLFLNDLRHRPNTALSLQEPLTLTDLPAVQAVLGKQGMFHGRDYRGVEVLADLRPIANSPWFMVAKVDAFEILAEARYRGVVTALFAGLFILLAAGVTAYGYRHRQARLYQDLYRSEREQREAQEQFRTTLYSIGDAVITTDIEGLVKQMNPVAELLTGWLEAEAKGKPLDEVFHIVNEDSRDLVENPVERVLREGIVVGLANHTLLISKEGAERPIADSGAPIRDETGGITGVVLVFRDQTQERMAQQAVKESEERLGLAMEASNEGVWDWNMTTDDVFRSPNFFSMLGYEAADFSGRFGEWQNLVHPEDLSLVQHTLEDYIAGKQETFETQFRMVSKSGDDVWILSRGKIVARDETGKPLRMIGTHTDVTERKRSEDALQHTASMLRGVLAASPVGIVLSQDRRIRWANAAWEKMFGFDNECEYMDQPTSIMHSSHENYEHVRKILYDNLTPGEVSETEATLARKGGTLFDAQISVNLLDPSDPSKGTISAISDISQSKRTEEALRESEARVRMKLDAILSPEGDIGTLDLADVMDASAIQALMDDFFSLTNIGVGILDLEGKILVATGWQDICTEFHRVHPETSRYCLESDTLLSGGLEQGSFKLYRCKNNMWDIATPIIVGGKHLGNLFLGQFLFEDESPDYETFRSQASQYGFDEQQYLAALERVPRWSRETVDTVMNFYARLANMLSTLSYSSIELARSLAEKERLVNSLRQSEERYRSLFENMLDGFAYCKMFFEDGKPQDFVYLDVNDSFERLTGLKNVTGKKVTEVIPGIKESNPELFEIYGRAALTGNPERFETYVDSLGIWLSTSVYSTEREHFIAVFDNISDRKRAEASLRQLLNFRQTLIDSIPNPVFYKDVEGKYIGCNEAYAALVGLPKEDVVGRSVYEVAPKEFGGLMARKGSGII